MRRLMVSQASAWIFFGIGRNWGAVKSASRCCYPLEGVVDKHLQEGGRYTGTGSFFYQRCAMLQQSRSWAGSLVSFLSLHVMQPSTGNLCKTG